MNNREAQIEILRQLQILASNEELIDEMDGKGEVIHLLIKRVMRVLQASLDAGENEVVLLELRRAMRALESSLDAGEA